MGPRLLVALSVIGLVACHTTPKSSGDGGSDAGAPVAVAAHSTSITISADGGRIFVVNADSDSVSIVDVPTRSLVAEIQLAASPPAEDADGGIFTPTVLPRTLALSPDGTTLYVVGERSGQLHVIDVASATVTGTVTLGSEPFGMVISPDGKSVYAACSQDSTVVKVDTASLTVTASTSVSPKPWALALSGGTLYATHLLAGQFDAFDPTTLALLGSWPIPDTQPRLNGGQLEPRFAHGKVRGLYDISPRPGSSELWVPHLLLGVDTPQPALDFEETVFPTLSILLPSGVMETRLSTNAQDVPQENGAFADVVSGPHAVAFTSDGAFALVVDTNSEDVLVVDANQQLEAASPSTGLLRPLNDQADGGLGHMPEGIVISPDGTHAYVDQRNTGDVAVIDIAESASTGITLALDGVAIRRLASDPMPAQLRLGEHLFFSANSDEYPITTNHWVACASCHVEGRSDAVTWLFAQGPRDTPSNAGGEHLTGFLFRTADRNKVQDYFRTIDIEQGGHFGDSPDAGPLNPLLDALAAYVNQAIPLPIPPTTDPDLVDAGRAIFNDTTVGCTQCHVGPAFTDSSAGNPTLNLAGPIVQTLTDGGILLHDVGTCVTAGNFFGFGPFPDVAHADIQGDARDACLFDTPTLRGIWDSAPYLHDGSMATLNQMFGPNGGVPGMGRTSQLSQAQVTSLVEYLKSL